MNWSRSVPLLYYDIMISINWFIFCRFLRGLAILSIFVLSVSFASSPHFRCFPSVFSYLFPCFLTAKQIMRITNCSARRCVLFPCFLAIHWFWFPVTTIQLCLIGLIYPPLHLRFLSLWPAQLLCGQCGIVMSLTYPNEEFCHRWNLDSAVVTTPVGQILTLSPSNVFVFAPLGLTFSLSEALFSWAYTPVRQRVRVTAIFP